MGTIKCYCLSNRGNLHCPLTTEPADLEKTFNYRVLDEDIVSVEIDDAFVCTNERNHSCAKCPFNK